MRLIFCILILIPTLCNGQGPFILWYDYEGPPHDTIDFTLQTVPNSVYGIEFYTNNIPDHLTIGLGSEKLSFYIGHNPDNYVPGFIKGYAEFIYNGIYLQQTVFEGASIPSYNRLQDTIPTTPEGMMYLELKVPEDVCEVDIRVTGNSADMTIYTFALYEIEQGYITVDTIVVPACGDYAPDYIHEDCETTLVIYENLQDDPVFEVMPTECPYDSLGQIIFYPPYDSFSMSGLIAGIYNIQVDNGFCTSEVVVEVPAKKICESVYVPNVFSPNFDGVNDTFIIYSKEQIDYTLDVFDRWGNFMFHGTGPVNFWGWDGTFRGSPVNPGVYVWQAVLYGNVLKGDVTCIK